jgi:hypothetical protein
MLGQPSAIVTGSSVGEVSQADPLFILGTTGNKKTPLYFCEGRTWKDDRTRMCFLSVTAFGKELEPCLLRLYGTTSPK